MIGENILVGNFVDGVCTHGTLTYECGDIYIGEFNDDLDRHGRGKFLNFDDDTTLEGIWENDVFINTPL